MTTRLIRLFLSRNEPFHVVVAVVVVVVVVIVVEVVMLESLIFVVLCHVLVMLGDISFFI